MFHINIIKLLVIWMVIFFLHLFYQLPVSEKKDYAIPGIDVTKFEPRQLYFLQELFNHHLTQHRAGVKIAESREELSKLGTIIDKGLDLEPFSSANEKFASSSQGEKQYINHHTSGAHGKGSGNSGSASFDLIDKGQGHRKDGKLGYPSKSAAPAVDTSVGIFDKMYNHKNVGYGSFSKAIAASDFAFALVDRKERFPHKYGGQASSTKSSLTVESTFPDVAGKGELHHKTGDQGSFHQSSSSAVVDSNGGDFNGYSGNASISKGFVTTGSAAVNTEDKELGNQSDVSGNVAYHDFLKYFFGGDPHAESNSSDAVQVS